MRFPRTYLACASLVWLALVAPASAAPAPPPRPAVETRTPEEMLKQAEESARKGDPTEAVALCTQVILSVPNHRTALALRGRIYSDARQDAKAIQDFSALLKLDSNATGIYLLRGWCQFRQGQFKESIADFDKVIELRPSAAPGLWQRGIVLYYAGRYEDGRKQFELHQTVNAHDVENAAWHFLCTARSSGLQKARDSLIAIEGDPRVPMKEVQAMFDGKAKPENVLEAARAAAPDKREDAQFYAHLYLGLYFEANAEALKAREHIVKAATGFKAEHAMGDVARVHAQVLKRQQKP